MKPLTSSTHPILDFFSTGGADHKGRTLNIILAADDDWLEYTHDYVQWLFPLSTSSAYNPEAPTLDNAIVRAFAESEPLRYQQRRAFDRMMKFYGFNAESDVDGDVLEEVYVAPADNFAQRSRLWITPGNHNYKRLTRILRSLSLLSSPLHAHGLGDALHRVARDCYGQIGSTTIEIWDTAAFGRTGRR